MRKSTCIILSLLFLFGHSAFADNSSSTPPTPSQGGNVIPKAAQLACPQCGVWQVSSSEPAGLVGEFVFIGDHHIVIPECGVFKYKVEKSEMAKEREDSNLYDLSLLLSPQWTLLFCQEERGGTWKMDIKAHGHGGADLILSKHKVEQRILWLTGWNIDREDPCYGGGGEQTARCLFMAEKLKYKMLSIKVDQTYEKLSSKKPLAKLPIFSAAHFYAVITKFCEDKEKNTGGGAWPEAWASTCTNRLLESKLKEFSLWNECVENKHKTCIFPTENFDRSSKSEIER